MRFDLVWRSKDNVNPSTVGLPSWDAGGVMLICIRYTPVVLVFELVVFAVRVGIPSLPERFDELFALLLVRELHEGFTLIVRDNPAYVFV
jgi:hypothetical protein